MNATEQTSGARTDSCPDDAVKKSLAALADLVDGKDESILDGESCEVLAKQLQLLHARFRAHGAVDMFEPASGEAGELPPELWGELRRLRGEHSSILGQLDWLTRNVDSIADRTIEDKDVFVLRAQELLAVLRRHIAEEDRLFYLAVWRDTGGEG